MITYIENKSPIPHLTNELYNINQLIIYKKLEMDCLEHHFYIKLINKV